MVLDYLVEQYTGILGKVLIPLTDNIKGNALEYAMTRFTTDVAYSNNVVPKFYDRLREIESAIATAKLGRPVKGYEGLYAKDVFTETNEAMTYLRKVHDEVDKMTDDEFKKLKESTSKESKADLSKVSKADFKRSIKLRIVQLAELANKEYDRQKAIMKETLKK
jgi:hypothetical protein